jgi:hypothetical protein
MYYLWICRTALSVEPLLPYFIEICNFGVEAV